MAGQEERPEMRVPPAEMSDWQLDEAIRFCYREEVRLRKRIEAINAIVHPLVYEREQVCSLPHQYRLRRGELVDEALKRQLAEENEDGGEENR